VNQRNVIVYRLGVLHSHFLLVVANPLQIFDRLLLLLDSLLEGTNLHVEVYRFGAKFFKLGCFRDQVRFDCFVSLHDHPQRNIASQSRVICCYLNAGA